MLQVVVGASLLCCPLPVVCLQALGPLRWSGGRWKWCSGCSRLARGGGSGWRMALRGLAAVAKAPFAKPRRSAGILGRIRGRRGVGPRAPEPVLPEEGVRKHEQLAHDGHQRDLRRLAAADELAVLGGQVGIGQDVLRHAGGTNARDAAPQCVYRGCQGGHQPERVDYGVARGEGAWPAGCAVRLVTLSALSCLDAASGIQVGVIPTL